MSAGVTVASLPANAAFPPRQWEMLSEWAAGLGGEGIRISVWTLSFSQLCPRPVT